jgi:hypothetical protein
MDISVAAVQKLPIDSATITVARDAELAAVLEVFADLRSWRPHSTNTAAGLTLEFEDTDAPNHPRRFYRARLMNP